MSDPDNPRQSRQRRGFDIMELTKQALLQMGNSASFRARSEGNYLIGLFEEAARSNINRPEAVFCRQIRASMTNVLPQMHSLEAQLSSAGSQRSRLQSRIDALEQDFYRNVNMAMATLRDELDRRNESSAFERIKERLPGYVREAIERKGIWIPGIPGAFQPSGGVPPNGITWTGRFD